MIVELKKAEGALRKLDPSSVNTYGTGTDKQTMVRKTSIVKIETNIPWVVFEDAKSGYWVGVCDPLRLTTQGETYQELVELIGETLDALFEDLLKEGELQEFLEEHGWRTRSPLPKGRSKVRFDLPFSIRQPKKHDLAPVAA